MSSVQQISFIFVYFFCSNLISTPYYSFCDAAFSLFLFHYRCYIIWFLLIFKSNNINLKIYLYFSSVFLLLVSTYSTVRKNSKKSEIGNYLLTFHPNVGRVFKTRLKTFYFFSCNFLFFVLVIEQHIKTVSRVKMQHK